MSETAKAAAVLATEDQLARWVDRFRVYRQPPTKDDLLAWLARFEVEHLQIAHKVLDAVIILSELEIQQCYKSLLEGVDGWSKKGAERAGRWFFVGVGGAGESGPAMLRLFREANGLTSAGWQSFFVSVLDLPKLALSAHDRVVFVDDFSGSGNQLTSYWPIMQELVASEATCYLLLTAVTARAAAAIGSETELQLMACLVLGDEQNLFHESCPVLSAEEKAALGGYGAVAWHAWPRGYENCGLTLVLSHKTPNNTIPILHANSAQWVGPFPRTLIAA